MTAFGQASGPQSRLICPDTKVIELDWDSIRPLNGSVRDGFEELCAQLARSETPESARFTRKGLIDGGVECYCTFANGEQWGWQAKYFTKALTDKEWNQFEESFKAALSNHPNLSRYYVCVPRDLSDSPRKGITTEFQRWCARKEKWKSFAADCGKRVEFSFWGSSELIERLSKEEHTGRVAFWFSNNWRFTKDWFGKSLDEALETAGTRYSPELHVPLHIEFALERIGRTHRTVDEVLEFQGDVRQAFEPLNWSKREDIEIPGGLELEGLIEKEKTLIAAFDKLNLGPGQMWELGDLLGELQTSESCASELARKLKTGDRNPSESNSESSSDQEQFATRLGRRISRLDSFNYRLERVRRQIQEVERYANCGLMILSGDAGVGKTHLLCDVASNRIEAGFPTVLLMGQRFTGLDDPWSQSLRQLDIADINAETFIGALEAAAQATNGRALLIIDALNEGKGVDIWPNHLPSFIERVSKSAWIATVISVRTAYLNEVIPEQVATRAIRATHQGFVGHEYEAARTYFAHYGIEFPSVPLLHPEFSNPLFLRVLCSGLQESGQTNLPRGPLGTSAIFENFVKAVNSVISARLDLDPSINHVNHALIRFAKGMSEANTGFLERSQAVEIVNGSGPAIPFSKSLFNALISEGLLIQSSIELEKSQVVFPAFERITDHFVAQYLIREHIDPGDPDSAFAKNGPLAYEVLSRKRLGTLESLCIQIPETCDRELPSLAPQLFEQPYFSSTYLQSIIWRNIRSFSDDTFTVFDRFLKAGVSLDEYYNSLLTVATLPNHPFNAEFLDSHLNPQEMSTRDAQWSIYLSDAYGERGALDRLLDWATALRSPDVNQLDVQSIKLCAVTLAWLHTTSNRFVRDRATNGLARLLTGHVDTTTFLVNRFKNVDDPYVAERIYAIAYSVAMRSVNTTEIANLAQSVFEAVFSSGAPTPHILLRDYARGVLERAEYLGAELELDIAKSRPPYSSEFPDIPSWDDLEAVAPRWRNESLDTFDPKRSRHAIRFSIDSGDFGRYVIGTNHGMSNWLSIPRSEPRWLSKLERLDKFQSSLDESTLQELEALRATERNLPVVIQVVDNDGSIVETRYEAFRQDQTAVSERDYQLAVERSNSVKSEFISRLSADQVEEFNEIDSMDNREPTIDLELMQRYILGRVFELGWSVEKFGQFDLRVNRFADRTGEKTERIGKKYQWIAFHEINAYVSDKYQFRDPYSDCSCDRKYKGPWQVNCRDIDPSCLIQTDTKERIETDELQPWWDDYKYSNWMEQSKDLDWLNSEDGFPDLDRILLCRQATDQNPWVNVRYMNSWRQPTPPGQDSSHTPMRNAFVHATGYFINSQEVREFLRWSEKVDFWGRWMPEPPSSHHLFLGEHSWSPAFLDSFAQSLGTETPNPRQGPACQIHVQVAAFDYTASFGDHDCSGNLGASLHVLNPRAIEGMGLTPTGFGADHIDQEGHLAAIDPTAHENGPISLLVRQDLLSQFLAANELELVWVVIGEKMAVGPKTTHEWAGSIQYSGAFRFNGGSISGGLTRSLHLPQS